MSKKIHKRKLRLYLDDPHCHWCGKKVVIVVPGDGVKQPHNLATIDHIVHKLDPKREVKYNRLQEFTVLSCHQCNQERGRNDFQRFKKLKQHE